ncbi:MAG: NADPH:quinone oxidoreductase [Caldithrix sp. RBG_13_44_9]|nr:MAG: NADPH:quinone oxidoreductase [Caldithrix sp. RBG_13_44_9]
MKAVLISQPGEADKLRLGKVPKPVPASEELLVKVKAAGINRADILQRRGLYPPPAGASQILGLEIAGVVEDPGHSCINWKRGDRIMGLLAGGGYAQYAVINQQLAMPIPVQLSFEEAAAIPEAFLTAFQALVQLGRLQAGQTVLIHAGGSGVGTAAIQLSREIGARVIITAGSDQKVQRCRSLGAIEGINYRTSEFPEVIMKATDGKGVNLILDFVGKPFWENNLSVLAEDGKLVILATMGGSEIGNFDLRTLMKKRMTITGSTLRNRTLEYKINLTREFAQFALPLFQEKKLVAIIDKVFTWEAAAEAHRYMEQNLNFGKIVLTISD